MAVQMLVFEGDWSVYESTPPTPDHTPTNGVEPSLKIQIPDLEIFWGRYENGISRLD